MKWKTCHIVGFKIWCTDSFKVNVRQVASCTQETENMFVRVLVKI